MSIHKVAVISDTHNKLRPEVIKNLKESEAILHAGDVANPKTLEELKSLGKLILIRGNCDGMLPEEIPDEEFFELFGKKIYMIHDRKQISKEADDADIIIFGHSHKYLNEEENGKIYLNPGSAGPRRFGNPVSMVLMNINTDNGEVDIEKIDLNEPVKTKNGKLKPEITDNIDFVLKNLKRGMSVEQIAKKGKIDPDSLDKICQIYFTHPGIDKQGILDRIEIQDL